MIYILFTCDAWKSTNSRSLRGAFTDLEKLEKAKKTLIKNGVVDYDKNSPDEHFDIVGIEENEFEVNGGYY